MKEIRGYSLLFQTTRKGEITRLDDELVANDNAYVLQFTLKEDDETPVDLTGLEVKIRFQSTEGFTADEPCEIVNATSGQIKYAMQGAQLKPGETVGIVSIYEDGVRESSSKFAFLVLDDLSSDKSVRDSPQYSELQQAVEAAEQVIGEAESILQSATTATNQAEQAAENANIAASSVQQAVIEATEAAESANTAASSAQQAAFAATNAANTATEALENVDSAISLAQEAAGNANTAAGIAENAAQKAEDAAEQITVDISIDSTITGEPGTAALVENLGTQIHPNFQFTIPRGAQGEKGERGDSGITTPNNGFFTVYVNEAGHLIAVVADNAGAPPLSIVDGHLIYTI